MTAADPAAEGRRRAGELVDLLTVADELAADALLDGLDDVRELAFLGAGLTAIARAEGRRLPPAQRAQASTRQLHLGAARDAARGDADGLRRWLRQAGEEVVLVRAQVTAAERVAG